MKNCDLTSEEVFTLLSSYPWIRKDTKMILLKTTSKKIEFSEDFEYLILKNLLSNYDIEMISASNINQPNIRSRDKIIENFNEQNPETKDKRILKALTIGVEPDLVSALLDLLSVDGAKQLLSSKIELSEYNKTRLELKIKELK